MRRRAPRRALLALLALAPAAPIAARPLAGPPVPSATTAELRARFVARAFAHRDEAIRRGDQPYGAVVVKDGVVVGDGVSAVITSQDPTAHAERQALRDAQRRLGSADLSSCELYGTSRACPMCEAAAHAAGIARMYAGPDGADQGAPRPGR